MIRLLPRSVPTFRFRVLLDGPAAVQARRPPFQAIDSVILLMTEATGMIQETERFDEVRLPNAE